MDVINERIKNLLLNGRREDGKRKEEKRKRYE